MVLLFLLLQGVLGDCGNLNYQVEGECVHKSLWPPESTEIFGYILAFLAANLANATGIGGGGIHVPILILVMRFTAHSAIPLSKALILGGAIVAVLLNIKKKHPDHNKPLIDFDVIVILQPVLLAGTFIGVLLNKSFPEVLILAMLILLLAFITRKTLLKGINLYKKETELNYRPPRLEEVSVRVGEDRQLSTEEVEMVQRSNLIPENTIDSSDEVVVKRTNMWPRKEAVVLLGTTYLAMVLVALAKGGEGVESIVGLEQCSVAYWGLLLAFLSFCGGASWVGRGISEVEWSPKDAVKYLAVGLLGGIASGLLGIGGGLVMAPLLLEIGLAPEAASATSSLLVMFTSSSTTLQFLVHGMLKMDYAGLLFGISMLASCTGIFFINSLIKKYNRSSIIVFALATAIGISTVLLPVFELSTIDFSKQSFSSLC